MWRKVVIHRRRANRKPRAFLPRLWQASEANKGTTMTALQEAAMRKALEALETCSYGDYSAKHVVDPSFDGDAVEAAIESLKAALAQQELPAEPTDDQLVKGVKAMRLFVTKNSVADFKLGYMAALAAAPAPQAQDGTFINEGTKSAPKPGFHDCTFGAAPQAQPICKLFGTLPVYDTPEPQAQEPHVWMIQGSHGTWKGEHAEMDAKAEAKRCGGTCYAYPLYTHPEPMRILTDAERAVREKARDK